MSIRPRRSTVRRLGAAAAGAASIVLVAGGGAGADVRCRELSGRYSEHLVTDGCTSPVGLCIAARYTAGPLHGTFSGAASSLVPTADTPTTGVVLFTTDSVADVTAWDQRGTLLIKNAGAVQTTGRGEIVDLQTIVGGTGDLAGATGAIRASGTFDPVLGVGTSEFEGTVCLA